MSQHPEPLFILSMPRSGSTLLQRLVGNSDDVATNAEPWILLPLLEALIADDVADVARYDGATATIALREFTDRLAHGRADLEAGLREFVTGLYGAASTPRAVYYLDKTPRYAAYLDELRAVFPDARYIVLQRDIREVIASIIRTWGGGKWNVFLYTIDLVDGFDRLTRFLEDPPDHVLELSFTDLVGDMAGTAARISDFLDIDVPAELLPADDPDIAGSVGDRDSPGRRAPGTVRTSPPWESHFEGVLRRLWLRWYLSQRARLGAVVPPAPSIRSARRLYDRRSDLVLVPISMIWPALNRWSSYRLETYVRFRRSSIVRHYHAATPSRRPAFGRVRTWRDVRPVRRP